MKKAMLSCAAVAAGLALAVPLATADHRPGHGKNPPQANPDLTITGEPNPVRYGRSVTISGRLRGQDNAGKAIVLEESPHPYTTPFRRVATATTDAQGDYSFRVSPTEHTKYRVSTRRQGNDPEVVSGEYLVYVRMQVTRRVSDRTPRDNEVVTFSGLVRPEHDGMTVRLQRRRADGTWRTKATATLVDAGATNQDASAYQAQVRITRDGVWRARMRGDANHFGNKSRRIRLDVP